MRIFAERGIDVAVRGEPAGSAQRPETARAIDPVRQVGLADRSAWVPRDNPRAPENDAESLSGPTPAFKVTPLQQQRQAAFRPPTEALALPEVAMPPEAPDTAPEPPRTAEPAAPAPFDAVTRSATAPAALIGQPSVNVVR